MDFPEISRLLRKAAWWRATCILIITDGGNVINNQTLLIDQISGDQILFDSLTLPISLVDFVVVNEDGQYVIQARKPQGDHTC